MIVKDVVSLAKYSELSGVAVKDNDEAIIAFINLGMLELYKRFPIKVEEHIVSLVDNMYYYEMPTDFMYPLEAFGETDKGASEETKELPINDDDKEDSVFFSDYDTLQVPGAVKGSHISIIYVRKPKRVTIDEYQDGVTELDLPDTLIDALLSYVGYRAYLGVRTDGQSENNAHWTRFERSCNKARELGVAFPSDTMNTPKRLYDKGFV